MTRFPRSLMPVRLLALATGLLLCGTASAGWTISTRPAADPSVAAGAVLVYPTIGDASADALRAALVEYAARADIRRLDAMVAHRLVDDRAFQRELAAALRRSAPRELTAALESSGNMHNPRVVPLRAHVEQSILETPTLQALEAVLSTHGLGFARAGIEKFVVTGPPEEPLFSFMLFLRIHPVPTPDHAPR